LVQKKLSDCLQEFAARGGVEPGCGFVEKQQFRSMS
jgi:hypothetical protein